ncbi:MAG TPA: peptidoglycan-binding domain-containing protein, partial [Acidobacteriota bacterium]|nr:peptidoglycan-binding domain-containing protein [Acidobacteriota bacterium]
MVQRIGSGSSSPPSGIDSTSATESAKQAETTQEPAAPASENATAPTVQPDVKGQVADFKASGDIVAARLHKEAGAPPGAPTGTEEKRLLKQPMKGDDVQDAQTQLNQWRSDQGKEPALKEDGKFGTKTDAAVRDFQKTNGLKSDGIVGPNTRDRLQLETDPNFKTLNADTQKQIRDQMSSYPKDQDSRTNLLKLGTDPNFAKLSREGQDQALKKLAANSQDPANLQNIQENVKDRAALENNA